MSKEDNSVVKFCKNCFGLEPCQCGTPEYKETWEFIYWAFKNLKM